MDFKFSWFCQNSPFVIIFWFCIASSQIISGPENKSVIIGSSVRFPCDALPALGNNVTRQWFFKGQPVDTLSRQNRIRVSSSDGSLSIQQVGPANIGQYKCKVLTPSGMFEESAMLTIFEKPGMPLHIRARLLNDSLPVRIEVSWKEGFNGNSPVINYVVQHRVLGPQGLWSEWDKLIENVGQEERSVLIDNLKPSFTYEFRVVAVNKFGPGIPSVSSNNITMPQQPPAAAPRTVAGSARSASSIMVQWQPPPEDQWNGDITGYVIRYRLADYPNIDWNFENMTVKTSTNFLLEDLITWREYEIQVAAYNNRGAGVFSPSQYITTLEGVPSEAPNKMNVSVLNSTSVWIEWLPPSQQQIPGVNQGYKIQFWKGEAGVGQSAHQTTVLPLSLSKMSQTVTSLEKYTAYNVTVLCYTNPGDGPFSVPIEITTDEDFPAAVEEFYPEEVLFSSMKVAWIPPLQPNGIITNYSLSWWAIDNVSESLDTTARRGLKTVSVPANSTRLSISDLEPSTVYTVEIRAATRVGWGPTKALEVESGVPPELPGPPTALAVTNKQARSVLLQFRPGYDGKTLISKWIVEAQIGQSTSWVPLMNISAPRETSVLVAPLHPHSIYRLRLSAHNVVGTSPPSEPSKRFQTLQAPPEISPADFAVNAQTSTALKVSWTPLASTKWNGDPEGYQVFYRRFGVELENIKGANFGDFGSNAVQTQWESLKVNNPGAGELTVSNLMKFAKYEVRMVAVNSQGQSNFTEILYAKTYPDTPSAPPGNVTGESDSSSSVIVRWLDLPSSHWNADPVGYRLYWKAERDGVNADEYVSITVDASASMHRIPDLRHYTVYRIHIRALTIVGEGPESSPSLLIRTKVDVPEQPSQVRCSSVQATEVRFAWNAPYFPNGIVTDYHITYSLNSTSLESAAQEEYLNVDLTSFLATRLSPHSWYRFGVRAKNEAGWGPFAVIYVFTFNSGSSAAPPINVLRNFQVPQQSRSISILWDTASDSKTPDRFYTVEYQPANEDWSQYPFAVPGTVKTLTIEGLQPSFAYKFRVRATNDNGESRWSANSEWIKTDEDAPSLPPINVKAVPYGSNSAKLTWQAPIKTSWNSDSLGYRIVYKKWGVDGLDQTRELPMGSSDNHSPEYLVSDLDRFHDYILRVQAFNRKGSSVPSNPVFTFVGYSIPRNKISGLKVDILSSTQVNVTWLEWDFTEPINGFKINYWIKIENGTIEDSLVEDVVDSRAGGVLLRDLDKFTTFLIHVWPFNKAGDGPFAAVDATTLQDKPGPVEKIEFKDILLDSVNVTWSPPSSPNGVIINYLVSYETHSLENEFVKKIQEKVFQPFLLAAHLEENVIYTFTVMAETVVGYGPPLSAEVKIGPQEGSPAAPRPPQLLPSESAVTLRWEMTAASSGTADSGRDGLMLGTTSHPSSPSSLSSPVTSYIVQYRVLDMLSVTDPYPTVAGASRIRRDGSVTGDWLTLARLENPVHEYTVAFSSLEAGVVYQFRVIARNRFGISRPSSASVAFSVPAKSEAKIWYLEWWFLVILALGGLLIIIVLVAFLCFTGKGNNKYKYERRNSSGSLQLDDGMVRYELRASQKNKRKQFGNNPPRPDPSTGMDEPIPIKRPGSNHAIATGSVSHAGGGAGGPGSGRHGAGQRQPINHSIVDHVMAYDPMIGQEGELDDQPVQYGMPAPGIHQHQHRNQNQPISRPGHISGPSRSGSFPNFYDTLPPDNHLRYVDGLPGDPNMMGLDRESFNGSTEDSLVSEPERADGTEDEEQANVSSIAQHYLNSSTQRADQSWRRALKTAHRAPPTPTPLPTLGTASSQQHSINSTGFPHSNSGGRDSVPLGSGGGGRYHRSGANGDDYSLSSSVATDPHNLSHHAPNYAPSSHYSANPNGGGNGRPPLPPPSIPSGGMGGHGSSRPPSNVSGNYPHANPSAGVPQLPAGSRAPLSGLSSFV